MFATSSGQNDLIHRFAGSSTIATITFDAGPGWNLCAVSVVSRHSQSHIVLLLVEASFDKFMVDLPCKKIQVDEIWSFCYAKQKNIPEELQGQFGYGDLWTWVAIDAYTKLVPSWIVGKRDADWAEMFMYDLSQRLKHCVQLTSDGHKSYLSAVEEAFGGEIDYATLVKMYGNKDE